MCSVASDDYALVYINGVLVDSDATTHHEASYWNRQISVPLGLINLNGPNIASVLVKNNDQWAFFDMQISARYTEQPVAAPAACSGDCGVKGQCIAGACVCESGWTGTACSTPLCSFSQLMTANVLPQGSNWRHAQWGTVSTTPENWFSPSYDDSWWRGDPAPFGTSTYNRDTAISAVRHLYRKSFLVDVPFDQVVANGTLSISSAANHRIWLNGVFLGQPIYPGEWHTAKYWNAVITVQGSLFSSTNTLAVEVNPGSTAFFDLKLAVTYATKTCTPVNTPSATTAAATTAAASTTTSASATTSAAANSGATTGAATTSGASTTSATTASDIVTPVTFIAKGSNWLFYNKSAPASTWTSVDFADSTWTSAPAPFVTGYAAYAGKGTPFGNTDYYFRSKFTIPTGKSAKSLKINVASDNYALVYVNGILVDSDPATWHEATYWNRQVTVDTSILQVGPNQVAVVVKNMDAWAFFDCEVTGSLGSAPAATSASAATTKPASTSAATTAAGTTGISKPVDPTPTPTPTPPVGTHTASDGGNNLESQSSGAAHHSKQDSCIFVITFCSLFFAYFLF